LNISGGTPPTRRKEYAMSATANKAAVISLSEGFGALVVQGPNIRVEMFDDGRIVAYTEGDVQKRHPASARTLSDAASPDALAIGAKMPDGTVYAGISPDTGKPMYTTPKDSGLCAEWRKAMDHAAGLDAHGHKDWRVPTTAELKVLFANARPSAILTRPVPIPPAGTGRPRRTTPAARGHSGSATAAGATASGTFSRPCAVSGDESFSHLIVSVRAQARSLPQRRSQSFPLTFGASGIAGPGSIRQGSPSHASLCLGQAVTIPRAKSH
jgi:hypothetical protein